MTAGDRSMEQGWSSPSTVNWSDLPEELLGVIRSRVASATGRVRFTAVCRSWRAAASQHPAPPALPLLVLSLKDWGRVTEKHLYCPEEGVVLHVPIPSKLRNMRFCGSYTGGWIAAVARQSKLAIVNLFSGIEVPLSRKQSTMPWEGGEGAPFIRKIIFSEAPTSSGCILAVLTDGQDEVALCRVGCLDGGWTIKGSGDAKLWDIVFFHGELYGLTRDSEKLFKFDIGADQDGAPVVTATHMLNVGPRIKSRVSSNATYIFGLHGKLVMAAMTSWTQNHKPFFKVFELIAIADGAHDYKWEEVSTLGDCALFLGRTCSSWVVHVQEGKHGGVEKNRIYYFNHCLLASKEYQEFKEEAYLVRSEHGDPICCWEDPKPDSGGDRLERIPLTTYYLMSGPSFPMWCFPPDF
ncbi:unnamed protein product [Alopecurus aequalis]